MQDLKNEFTSTTELDKLEREVLQTLPNQKYQINTVIQVVYRCTILTQKVCCQFIVGASDFAKIKMGTCPRLGQIGEPFAEQTKMGWVIIQPGRASDRVIALFTKTSVNDYEKLCDTDALELKEIYDKHDDWVYEKFKKQLKNDEEGSYETMLV